MKSALLVSGSAAEKEAVLRALERRGYEAEVSDPATALPRFERGRFDVVVLHVEAHDSLAISARLRAASPEPHGVHVLALLEPSAGVDAAAVIDAGSSDCLSWPASASDLDLRLAVATRLIAANPRELEGARPTLVGLPPDLASVFYESPIAMNISSLDSRILEVNEAWLRDFGYPRERVLGRTSAELGLFFGADDEVAIVDAIREHGRMRDVEMTYRTSAGQILRSRSSFTLMKLEGHPRVLAMVRSITAERLAEQLLAESRDRYEMLSRATNDMVWDYDVIAGHVSRTLQFGYTAEQMMPTLAWWSERIHEDDRAETLEGIGAVLGGAGASWSAEYRFRRADGAFAFVHDRGFVKRDAEGTAVRMIGSMCDVTERREMESRLLLSDRLAAVGTLAAGVAHEINNPLTYAMAHLDLAVKEVERMGSEERALSGIEHHLRTARDGTERVRRIVRDLRTFSRGDDDKRGPVDVRSVLDFCLEMAQNEIRHRARLVRDYEEVVPVFGNESRLAQVFLNLLVNAAQAIPEDRAASNEISVSTRHEPGGVVIEIRDSGAGIPPEILSRIFDPFFTTKPVGMGTGLGLSICQSIIASHGGKLSLTSAVGVGTTSRVLLPRATVEERARVEPPPAPALEAPHRRGRILIVDDEPVLAGVMVEALEDHDVTVVTSGLEALERCDEGAYDVIFCDLMMPDMSGMEVFEKIRSSHAGLEERIVFVTGGAFTPKARAFLDSTTNLRIEKPFHIDALQRLACELMQKWAPRPDD